MLLTPVMLATFTTSTFRSPAADVRRLRVPSALFAAAGAVASCAPA